MGDDRAIRKVAQPELGLGRRHVGQGRSRLPKERGRSATVLRPGGPESVVSASVGNCRLRALGRAAAIVATVVFAAPACGARIPSDGLRISRSIRSTLPCAAASGSSSTRSTSATTGAARSASSPSMRSSRSSSRTPTAATAPRIVQDQLFVHPGGSLVILDRLRLAVDMPIALYNAGDGGDAYKAESFDAPSQAALGDTAFVADLRIFGRYGDAVTGALGLEAIAPTGSRSQYTGDGKTRFVPRLQFAGTYKEIDLGASRRDALSHGGRPHRARRRAATRLSSAARSAGDRTTGPSCIGPEVYGSASVTQPSPANAPVEAIVGAHYAFAREWRVNLGAGPGSSSGLGTPLLRMALSIRVPAKARGGSPKKVVRYRSAERPRSATPSPTRSTPAPIRPSANIDPALNGCPLRPTATPTASPTTPTPAPTRRARRTQTPSSTAVPPTPIRTDPRLRGRLPVARRRRADRQDAERLPPRQRSATASSTPRTRAPASPARSARTRRTTAARSIRTAITTGSLNERRRLPERGRTEGPDPKKNGCPKAILRGAEIRILDQVRFEANSARIAKGKDARRCSPRWRR